MDINIFLFDQFETLDVFGPVEIFGCVPEYRLNYCSLNGDITSSRHGVRVLTTPLPQNCANSMLLIPGGRGVRTLVHDTDAIAKLKTCVESCQYCLTVCTGSALLAKTGLINQCQATSNKQAWDWVTNIEPAVNWERHARWCVDGKYYTSSGVSAGMDMALAFVAEHIGQQDAQDIATLAEYIWNQDKNNDPFA